MPNKKSYGAKKDYEQDVVQSIDSGNPSKITNAAFITATYKGSKSMRPDSPRVGKWLFHVEEKYIDDTWHNVKKAIEEGKLWKTAKTSTAWRSKGNVYVICVYTYDHDDEKDVMSIRDHLRTMGFKRPVSYKTDAQTIAGIYSNNTDGIAKYKA